MRSQTHIRSVYSAVAGAVGVEPTSSTLTVWRIALLSLIRHAKRTLARVTGTPDVAKHVLVGLCLLDVRSEPTDGFSPPTFAQQRATLSAELRGQKEHRLSMIVEDFRLPRSIASESNRDGLLEPRDLQSRPDPYGSNDGYSLPSQVLLASHPHHLLRKRTELGGSEHHAIFAVA